jgi:hypothetical protein
LPLRFEISGIELSYKLILAATSYLDRINNLSHWVLALFHCGILVLLCQILLLLVRVQTVRITQLHTYTGLLGNLVARYKSKHGRG